MYNRNVHTKSKIKKKCHQPFPILFLRNHEKGWWPRNSAFVRLPTDRAATKQQKGSICDFYLYVWGEQIAAL